MDERVMQFRVGVMVLATLIITAILVLLFVGELPTLTRGGYTIEIVFREAPGVTHNSPVRKSGIRIGRVTNVRFSENDKEVIVSAKIDGDRRIYQNETCRLTRSLVLGDVALEFAPNPAAPSAAQATEIVGGDVIRGQVDQDLSDSVTKLEPKLDRTMDSLAAAANQLQATLDQVNRMLKQNETTISSVVQQADRTLATVQKTLENANDVIGDPRTRANLKTAFEELPGVLKDTRRTVGVLGDSITELQGAIGNVEKFTQPLADRGDSLVNNLDTSLTKLNTLTDHLLAFSDSLNDPRSSLGQLVRDPELYQHVNRAAKNLEELTRQLKPVVSDARVFSDKIARHPEMLGVRGAIQKSPGIK